MTRNQKKMLVRILVTALLTGVFLLIPEGALGRIPLFLLWLVPYGIIGWDILKKAGKGIMNRQVFDENFLMAVATLGALAIGLLKTGDYVEAVAVMLFYQIGELWKRRRDPRRPIRKKSLSAASSWSAPERRFRSTASWRKDPPP